MSKTAEDITTTKPPTPPNPYAFPRAAFAPPDDRGSRWSFPNRDETGMTLRDYFAANAMQALIMRGAWDDDQADEAYRTADAMLKARCDE